MAELKTKPTSKDVTEFLNKVDAGRRSDCFALVDLMRSVTGAEPVMWGPDVTLYITSGIERYPSLMKKLGKHKSGKSCLYIKTLGDVDVKVLRELVTRSVEDMPDKRTDR